MRLLFFCLCPSMSHWSIHWCSKTMADFLLYGVSKGNRWGRSVWSLCTNKHANSGYLYGVSNLSKGNRWGRSVWSLCTDKHANSGYPTLMNKPAVVTLYWWMGQWWSSYTDSKWANSGHPALMNRPTVVTLHWWMGHWWSPYTVELAICGYPTLINGPSVVTKHWWTGQQ